MHGKKAEEESSRRLRAQRNLFSALAALALGSIALALPRKLASHRELKTLSERLVELQTSIVQSQQHIRETQGEIERVQAELGKGAAK
jgi:uncharacterized membrane protein YccC